MIGREKKWVARDLSNHISYVYIHSLTYTQIHYGYTIYKYYVIE